LPDIECFYPYAQYPIGQSTFVIRARTSVRPDSLVPSVQAAIRTIDSQLPVDLLQPMMQTVDDALAGRKLALILVGTFAWLALLLAAVGLYGVLSYSVAQRTREIGVRMSTGAGQGDILRLVVGQGFHPVLVGMAAGLAVAIASAKLISAYLFGVGARDPLTLGGIVVVVIAVALLACVIPANRASRLDPLQALRME
jgi:ABC-type antimicrobial peptide transport system permease subunit